MKLVSLSYKEFSGKSNYWELEKFNISNVNLITAKNATGKSRIINIIRNISLLLANQRAIFNDANFETIFEDGEDKFSYSVDFGVNYVKKEEFKHNGTVKVKRENDTAEIYFEEVGRIIKSNIPKNVLTISRRDNLQHPYFEKILEWANNTVVFYFGTDLGKNTLFSQHQNNQDFDVDIRNTNSVQLIFSKGIQKFKKVYKRRVINDFAKLGYNITDLNVDIMRGVSIPNAPIQSISGIWVKENDIKQKVEQNLISQGMFRALSIIIQLNYLELMKIPCCVAIDDIGECLDYDRSTALINLIIEKSKESFVQLIMTTNDRFVMNTVDLEHWCVVTRDKQKCNVLNYKNSKEIFDDFKFTGLNNFDFLSTEFYINGLEEESE